MTTCPQCGQEIKEPPQPKWPGRVTSSKTECAHAACVDTIACRKGCAHQQPITWADAPTLNIEERNQ